MATSKLADWRTPPWCLILVLQFPTCLCHFLWRQWQSPLWDIARKAGGCGGTVSFFCFAGSRDVMRSIWDCLTKANDAPALFTKAGMQRPFLITSQPSSSQPTIFKTTYCCETYRKWWSLLVIRWVVYAPEGISGWALLSSVHTQWRWCVECINYRVLPRWIAPDVELVDRFLWAALQHKVEGFIAHICFVVVWTFKRTSVDEYSGHNPPTVV